jgi:hypothetical protein
MKHLGLIFSPCGLALMLLITGCNQPATNGNANAPSPSPSSSQTSAAGSPGPRGPHCGDSPPANPANCKLAIDEPFKPGCTVPFNGAQSHDIDLHCPNEGCAKNDNDKAQNKMKNNFCAAGPAIQINETSIDKLQAAIDLLVQQGNFSYGDKAPPPADRAKLQGLSSVDSNGNTVTLGEGKQVVFEGFVLDAKHDDTYVLGSGPQGFAGEGVNCNNSLFDWNDIHIALGQTASAAECSSVTAEIIPHFRPLLSDRFDTNECTSPHVTNPLPVKGQRVRITGQLFFDGSHTPGACGGPMGAHAFPRRSVWEIHPVYAIEIFDASQNKFVPLEEWAQSK